MKMCGWQTPAITKGSMLLIASDWTDLTAGGMPEKYRSFYHTNQTPQTPCRVLTYFFKNLAIYSWTTGNVGPIQPSTTLISKGRFLLPSRIPSMGK